MVRSASQPDTVPPLADVVVRDLGAMGDRRVARALVDSGLLAMALLEDGRLCRVTPGMLALFDLPAAPEAADLENLARTLGDALGGAGGSHVCVECEARRDDGVPRNVELRAHLASGAVDRGLVAVIASDVTERSRELTRLEFQATHDPLTGLPNRALLLNRLEHSLAGDRRHGFGCAVLIVDLDGFKPVNDRHGHAAGDRLLQEVAERMTRCVRASDTVARLGGDEFVVVASPVGGREEAVVLAARIVTDLAAPFLLDGEECRIGASVGVAVRGERREDAALLLSEADAAMYHAKASGRGRFALAEVDGGELAALEPVRWTADRDVGIPEVDREHRALSDAMNALLDSVRAGVGGAVVADRVQRILSELARHFATEERYMRRHPGAWDREHRAEHRRVLADLRCLTGVASREHLALAVRYLHQWLYRHAGSFDRLLGRDSTGPPAR